MRDDACFVIQTYQRPYYVASAVESIARQLPAANIYIADAASNRPDMLAILDNLETRGCHVARQTEHQWGDWCKNRGWEWAIERGAEFVFLAEDGILPSLNMVAEICDVLALHDSFWIGAPIMSNTPRLAPRDPFQPEPGASGRIPDGETDDRARVFSSAEAVERAAILAKTCQGRTPRWRTADHLDSVLLCVKRAAWQTVGIFDDAFGQGWNCDADYFYRAATAGGEMVICERAFAEHFRDDFDFGVPRGYWRELAVPHTLAKWPHGIPPIPWTPREGND